VVGINIIQELVVGVVTAENNLLHNPRRQQFPYRVPSAIHHPIVVEYQDCIQIVVELYL